MTYKEVWNRRVENGPDVAGVDKVVIIFHNLLSNTWIAKRLAFNSLLSATIMQSSIHNTHLISSHLISFCLVSYDLVSSELELGLNCP